MKARRRLGGILLIITALIIMQLPVSEADAAASASDFKITGNKLEKYQGTGRTVTIPEDVVTVGKSAFEDNQTVEKVLISDDVKNIQAYAFWNCDNLKTVSLGKGLKEISDYVFTNCKGLKEMSVPSNIHSIGIQAFADCVNLTDITIPPDVTFIHETAFDGCRKLVIHCEEGSYASKYAQEFYERQQEMPEYEDVAEYEPVVEQTEEVIDPLVSEETQPEPEPDTPRPGLTLGSTSVVGNRAVVFIDNTSLQVYAGVPDQQEEQVQPEQQNEGVRREEGSIQKYRIVDGRTVADQSYYRNQELGELTLQTGIVEIGEFAFARSSLSAITLPAGVRTISYGAFYHCDGLKQVNLPDSVMNVEPKAFTHTLWVEEFLDGEQGDDEDFLISGGVLIAYRGENTDVTVPEGVRCIAAEAFENHKEIETLSLPESLETIGEEAFKGCGSLASIQIDPESRLRQIKDRAFRNCNLSALQLPGGIEELGQNAFDEAVVLSYAEEMPRITYENTAMRLSNEVYRGLPEETRDAGVDVTGQENVAAVLEGAQRRYRLHIQKGDADTRMGQAFMRNLHRELPEDAICYELEFTDDSNIPISKLGRQVLTVTMPFPENMKGKKVEAVQLDRNGQLEALVCDRVRLDGVDTLRLQMNKVSAIALYSSGEEEDTEILELSTEISNMSAGPAAQDVITPGMWIKWLAGGGALVLGLFLALKRVA